jgi:ABC-type bacteriocin/lantibiotic exporter with double-glycine peptidase domain
MFKNIHFIKNILRIWNVFDSKKKKNSIYVVFFSFINTLLDLLGLGLFIPLILIVFQDENIINNPYLGPIYNYFAFSSEINFIFVFGVLIMFTIVSKNILSLWIQKFQLNFSFSIFKYVSQRLFKYYLKSKNLFLDDETGSKITREIYITSIHFTEFFIVSIITLINELVIIFTIFILLLIYNPSVVLILIFSIVPIATVFYKKYNSILKSTGKRENDFRNKINSTLYDTIYGLPEIQIFQSSSFFYEKYNFLLENFIKEKVKIFLVRLSPTKILEIIVFFGVLVIILSGLFFNFSKSSILTLLSIYSLAAFRLLPSFNRVTLAVINLKTYEYTLEIIDKINPNSETVNKSLRNISPFQSFKISKISYKYPNTSKYLFENFSLEIIKGDIIGISGESGSGKSTLIKIIAGLLRPNLGEIYYNKEICNDDLISLWQHKIGYVRQNVFVYNSSIKNNIAFGVDEQFIDYDKLNYALKLSNLEEFIASNENGIEYKIGENGSKLSGGQIQRVGIARAIYFDSEIILFDEPMSALDELAQIKITKTIINLARREFTIIISSHQKNIFEHCNKKIMV